MFSFSVFIFRDMRFIFRLSSITHFQLKNIVLSKFCVFVDCFEQCFCRIFDGFFVPETKRLFSIVLNSSRFFYKEISKNKKECKKKILQHSIFLKFPEVRVKVDWKQDENHWKKLKKDWIYIYITESLGCTWETNTAL